MTKQILAIFAHSHLMRCAYVLLCIALSAMPASIVIAADCAASAADIEKLQEQVRTMDKDMTVLKEIANTKLEAQNNRIADLGTATTQQSNYLSAISVQTTAVSNKIAWFSVLITIFIFIAGVATYFNAASKARDEARKWFDEQALENKEYDLSRQMTELEVKVTKVTRDAEEATKTIEEKKQIVEDRFKNALAIFDKTESISTRTTSAEHVDVDERIEPPIEEKQMMKTEKSSLYEEFFVKAGDFYVGRDYQSALECLIISHRLGEELHAKTSTQVNILLAQGLTLSALTKHREAVAVYEKIEQSYAQLKDPELRALVARALVNKGVSLGELNKRSEAIAVYNSIEQLYGHVQQSELQALVAKALVNKAMILGQLNINDTAVTTVFENVVQRYSYSTDPQLIVEVARAQNGLGFTFMLYAKQNWSDSEDKAKHLASAFDNLKNALMKLPFDHEYRRTTLGNMGYCLFLRGEINLAVEPTKACLDLGGINSFDAQKADAKLYRVEPEDTQYEALLDKLWAELQAQDTQVKI
jgi:tetratricopeptide (TPR) repeat protein